jgi:lathosterol oxidase
MEQTLETISRIFGTTVARYFVIAGIAFVLCYKLFPKKLTASKIQARSAGSRDFKR